MGSYDKHNAQTRELIKEALLCVLETKAFARISMSDIARQAHISRSTVYAHFPNVQTLFESCTIDFLAEARSLKSQLRNGACNECVKGRPFCEVVRNAGKYKPLVDDPHFFPTALRYFMTTKEGRRLIDDYLSMGLTAQQARVVALFQMSGCFAVASNNKSSADWKETQGILDEFIRGGICALRKNMHS